jgi:DNA-binding beta-propeller fold protein YncE
LQIIHPKRSETVVSNTIDTMYASATIEVGFEPGGMAITLDGTQAYVANEGSDTASVIDTAT